MKSTFPFRLLALLLGVLLALPIQSVPARAKRKTPAQTEEITAEAALSKKDKKNKGKPEKQGYRLL
ncbi:hypothetical protein ACH6CV_08675, partial [Bacillota bacterium Meth-B3]